MIMNVFYILLYSIQGSGFQQQVLEALQTLTGEVRRLGGKVSRSSRRMSTITQNVDSSLNDTEDALMDLSFQQAGLTQKVKHY